MSPPSPIVADRARPHRALALLVGGVVLGGGCGSPRPITPAAPATRLLRVYYRAGEQYPTLDVDRAIVSTLAAAAAAGAESPPSGVRRYEVGGLAPGSTAVIDDDGGPTADPALLALRRESLEALREAAAAPRRELGWHAAALAGFAGEGLTAAELERIRERLFTPAETEAVALALYPRAHRLDEAFVAAWRSEDNAAIRLVPLVRGARLGSKRDLAEIFRLALEYHGALPLFYAAVRSLFPPQQNPELYRGTEPPTGPDMAGVITRLHRGLARAMYRDGAAPGWSASPES